MNSAIESLKKEYKEEINSLYANRPDLMIRFDWSSDAYRVQHLEEFVGKLNQI